MEKSYYVYSTESIFINYDTEDGLQGYIFNRHASHINKDGELLFGGRNGVNAFFPGKINTNPADIVISDFYISNQAVNPLSIDSPIEKHILDTDQISLNFDQNDLSFEISTLRFARPKRNSLAYKMEGFNDTGIGLRNRHMRENYLETDKYPMTYFKGKLSRKTHEQSGKLSVTAEGVMFIHGIEQKK